MRTTAYRYPNEQLVLAGTLLLVLIVIAFTATATLCTGGLFILAFIAISFASGRSHHQALVRQARRVMRDAEPGLA